MQHNTPGVDPDLGIDIFRWHQDIYPPSLDLEGSARWMGEWSCLTEAAVRMTLSQRRESDEKANLQEAMRRLNYSIDDVVSSLWIKLSATKIPASAQDALDDEGTTLIQIDPRRFARQNPNGQGRPSAINYTKGILRNHMRTLLRELKDYRRTELPGLTFEIALEEVDGDIITTGEDGLADGRKREGEGTTVSHTVFADFDEGHDDFEADAEVNESGALGDPEADLFDDGEADGSLDDWSHEPERDPEPDEGFGAISDFGDEIYDDHEINLGGGTVGDLDDVGSGLDAEGLPTGAYIEGGNVIVPTPNPGPTIKKWTPPAYREERQPKKPAAVKIRQDETRQRLDEIGEEIGEMMDFDEVREMMLREVCGIYVGERYGIQLHRSYIEDPELCRDCSAESDARNGKICAYCGEIFIRPTGASAGQYCRDECRTAARNERRRDKRADSR